MFMELDLVQKVLEFEKNVLEPETHDFKMGKNWARTHTQRTSNSF